MEDFDPRTWTNIPTWRVNLGMGFSENIEVFEGLRLSEIIDALINHAIKVVVSENSIAADLSEAFLSEVYWHNIAYEILDMLDVKQRVDNYEERNINMEDFDPRTWTNIPTWRANLEMRFTENLEDFAGLGLDEITDALLNHALKKVESENPLATDLAEAFFFEVDWHNIAQVILDKLE